VLVTTDEVPDPQALDVWLDVNGQRMQAGNTRTMIFDCAEIVS
jgi:2,4-didehydro-3-deoxy-L-rhamnonate hydrolase